MKNVVQLKAQLKLLAAASATITDVILKALYADDLAEAYRVMDRFRDAGYVRNLRDDRAELEFLAKRQAELELELKTATLATQETFE